MATGGDLGMAVGTDVPLEHLDYGYIGDCKDATEVEKLLNILRYVIKVSSQRSWNGLCIYLSTS